MALLLCLTVVHISVSAEVSVFSSGTPGISVGDIAKAIGEMWRGLSEEEEENLSGKTWLQIACMS